MVASFKWSVKDWHELIESGVLEGKPVQLIEGEIVGMSPEGVMHSHTNRSVADYLKQLLAGIAYVSESHPITLIDSEPEPDVAIVELPENIYEEHHPYPKNIYWLIEISQKTLKFDLERKSRIYASNEIPEYWVIDLINRKIIVHTQAINKQYYQVIEHTNGIINPQAFPNIAIEVSKLLIF
jgi:Uma2 family endonuclease